MRHPEQRDDEFFITNANEECYHSGVRWKTKRRGYIAYDTVNNQPIIGCSNFPVFAKCEEIRTADITLYNSLMIEQSITEE